MSNQSYSNKTRQFGYGNLRYSGLFTPFIAEKLSLNWENWSKLYGHVVKGKNILPGSTYIGLITKVADRVFGENIWYIEKLSILRPVYIADVENGSVLIVVMNMSAISFSFECHYSLGRSVSVVAKGNISISHVVKNLGVVHSTVTRKNTLANRIEFCKSSFYLQMSERGLHYDSYFRTVSSFSLKDNYIYGHLSLHNAKNLGKIETATCLFDGCFQLMSGFIADKKLYAPASISGVLQYGMLQPDMLCIVYNKKISVSKGICSASMSVYNSLGERVVDIDRVLLVSVDRL